MKKKIIASLPLIAMASTGAVFAQSSVNLYGNLDEAVTVIDGKKTWSGLNSGGSSDSYFGLRGQEDPIGDGHICKTNRYPHAGSQSIRDARTHYP